LDANCAFAQEEFAGDLPSLNLSAAMDLSEQSIQEQRDLIIKDGMLPSLFGGSIAAVLPSNFLGFPEQILGLMA
jgi:hypothetical protein